jgi:nicotinamide-nucleotide adenylyltransferase
MLPVLPASTSLAWCARPPSSALLRALGDDDLVVIDDASAWADARDAVRRHDRDRGADDDGLRVLPFAHHGLRRRERARALGVRFAPGLRRVIVDDEALAVVARGAGWAVNVAPGAPATRAGPLDVEAGGSPTATATAAALVVVRGQPPHAGHVDLVRRALALRREVVVVLAAADRGFAPDDPFTAGERVSLWRALLGTFPVDDRRRCWLAPLPSPPEPALALSLAFAVVPRCDVVVTRNPVLAAMADAAGLVVDTPPTRTHDDAGARLPISATLVRARLRRGEPLDGLVPDVIAGWLASAGARRVQALARPEHGVDGSGG